MRTKTRIRCALVAACLLVAALAATARPTNTSAAFLKRASRQHVSLAEIEAARVDNVRAAPDAADSPYANFFINNVEVGTLFWAKPGPGPDKRTAGGHRRATAFFFLFSFLFFDRRQYPEMRAWADLTTPHSPFHTHPRSPIRACSRRVSRGPTLCRRATTTRSRLGCNRTSLTVSPAVPVALLLALLCAWWVGAWVRANRAPSPSPEPACISRPAPARFGRRPDVRGALRRRGVGRRNERLHL